MAGRPRNEIDTGPRKTSYSAPALEKAFDIIEELARAPIGLTVTEMAQRLGRSVGEIFRIVIVMETRGWLAKDPDTDRFSVTYRMLELAHQATPAQELARAAPSVMYALAQESGQSCHMVVPADGHGLVVLREAAPGPTSFALRLGAEADLLASCSGHVILAFSDEGARATILRRVDELEPKARKDLDAMVERVRSKGYEAIPSARTRGVVDISFPIFGFDGRLRAALTSPFLEIIDGTQCVDLDGMQELLATAARQISHRLGWSGVQQPDPGPGASSGSSAEGRGGTISI